MNGMMHIFVFVLFLTLLRTSVAQEEILIGDDAEQPCKVIGFAMTLPTGVPTDDEFNFDPRRVTEKLDDGFIYCRDPRYERNIEAITSGNCTYSRINIHLVDATTGVRIAKRVERAAPYFLYGNIDSNATILGGDFLNPNLTNSTLGLQTYVLRSNPVGRRMFGKEIKFDVVNCFYYDPINECSDCAASGKVCEGSLCVTPGYIRITLLKYDSSYFDYAMNITTPAGGLFAAVNDPTTHGIELPNYDLAGSGGFVDVSSQYISCRSLGVWVKNIVFPTKELAPKGTYNINMEELSECGFEVTEPSRFLLKIYLDNQLLAQYTHLDGLDFNFTI